MSDNPPPASDDPLSRLRARARRQIDQSEVEQRPQIPELEQPPQIPELEPEAPVAEPVAFDDSVAVVPSDPPAPAAGRSPGLGARAMTALAVVAVGIVVAGSLSTLALLHLSHQRAIVRDRSAILSAAVETVSNVSSYNWQHLAQDEQTGEQGLTPAFRASYQAFFSKQVAPNARKYHTVTTASIDTKYGAGIETQDGTSSATVLIYLDQVSTNKLLAHPRLDQTRVDASMVNDHGRWLVSDITTE